ncbi:MAG: hypothetical protein COW00_15615 [Bdellovibrio sp. CG12_big_fil_rev_8_21_14_0_65_39_13]|nr:MAG: hypothetical protein COW78_05480 [Bdellovibrio sp. CG22_combo_CG10-13_8_21_14_all_39_27]PIQ58427.1 MAG: hypothetical protein COW00_15615 [Bdellovibrio sp. CG12_big_fil_rev_8_21_14_0_65_39_13]PIR35380.1 MAG: hypothetical protein COV37_07830 [Bdellovibrio sp. CG11_big_fil_rev_8_21_14_0_20_39_38]PJB52394.1 MAG: hypothetical protein CO099_12790 [Bdellovibrio sp. CG_4_9_14_3_um_filter_39_7]
MKILGMILSLLLCTNLFAGSADISAFAFSLERAVGLNRHQLEEIGSKIRIKYSTRMNSNAAATYNPLFNLITFNPEVSIEDMGVKRVRTLSELEKTLGPSYWVHASTIFHEFAHAELDTIISKPATNADQAIRNVLFNQIKPWLAKNFPKFRSQSAMHELYAYYHDDVIETYYNDIGDIYLMNGWNTYNKRCFAGPQVKQKFKELSQDDFKNFFVPESPKAKIPYRDRIKIQFVYVNGKDFDISTIKNDPFKMEWFHAIYDYLEYAYSPVSDMAELTQLLRDRSPDRKALAECREKLWITLSQTAL